MWAPRVRLLGTFILGNENAGGSAICIHKDLLQGAVETHAITCQGRDHTLSTQSGHRNLVVVNNHFKPELTLRSLRERQRLITPHWPPYPNAVGIVMEFFLIMVNQRKEGSMCGIKPSPTVTREKLPYLFHSLFFFLMSSRLLNLTTPGGILRSLELCARCQGLIVSLLTCLWLRRVTFIATPHVFENLGNRSIPSDHAAVCVDFQKADYSGATGQTCSKLDVQTSRFFCSTLKRLHDGHQHSADPFGAVADVKAVTEKAKRQTVRELSRKTPDRLGAKLLTASYCVASVQK